MTLSNTLRDNNAGQSSAAPARVACEALIARLIDLLDAMDGDSDYEPSLGAPEGVDQLRWSDTAAAFLCSDLEEQCEGGGGEEGCEDEGCYEGV